MRDYDGKSERQSQFEHLNEQQHRDERERERERKMRQ